MAMFHSARGSPRAIMFRAQLWGGRLLSSAGSSSNLRMDWERWHILSLQHVNPLITLYTHTDTCVHHSTVSQHLLCRFFPVTGGILWRAQDSFHFYMMWGQGGPRSPSCCSRSGGSLDGGQRSLTQLWCPCWGQLEGRCLANYFE